MDMPPEIIELIYSQLAKIEFAPQWVDRRTFRHHRTCAPICRALLPFTRQYKLRNLRFHHTLDWNKLLSALVTEPGKAVRSIHLDMKPLNLSTLWVGMPFKERFGYPHDYYMSSGRDPLDSWLFPSWTTSLLELMRVAQAQGIVITGEEVTEVLEVRAAYDEQVAIMNGCKKRAIVEFKRRQQQAAGLRVDSAQV